MMIRQILSNIPSMIYLQPGEAVVSDQEIKVCTVLGSCVSVCLWDKILKQGGVNHYLFPEIGNSESIRQKYGDTSTHDLVQKLFSMGSKPQNLIAKIFGGSRIGIENSIFKSGIQNSYIACKILKQFGVPVVSEDTGGYLGRRIDFDIKHGEVILSYLNKDIKR